MEHREGFPAFSLQGGPLYRAGVRLGLVRDRTDTTMLGIALGVFLWVVLIALALLEGLGHATFAIATISVHVRLLVAIPLLFACETLIDPRMAAFVQGIVRSQVLPPCETSALEGEIARIDRWRDAWWPEAFFLLAVVLLQWVTPNVNFFSQFSGATGASGAAGVSDATWTSQWYWAVCITLFRFLLLRWLWRVLLWCFFLWRVSRLDLRLVPTHPDRAGGLGFLELVQAKLAPLLFAMSAVQSASLAQDVASGRTRFEAVYAGVAVILVVDAVLVVGPASIFYLQLARCWLAGMSDFGALGERYANAFTAKWLRGNAPSQEDLLGTPDIQSLADLNNSVGAVRSMRFVPVSLPMLVQLGVAALLPLLPLLLFKYPVTELLVKFVERLSGL